MASKEKVSNKVILGFSSHVHCIESSGLEVIKNNHAQLSMKCIMLINVKMSTIFSMVNTTSDYDWRDSHLEKCSFVNI